MNAKNLLTSFLLLTLLTSHSQSKNPLLQMATIDGGSFMMGSKDDNQIAETDEQKQHKVVINTFSINKFEVTVWEWKDYCKKTKKKMPATPAWGWNDNNPINNITWVEAIQYCNWLSKQDGLKPAYAIAGPNITCDFAANGYRLPTEAEWEFVAKGGKKSKGYAYSGSNKIDDVAWHLKNSQKKPHVVGTKMPNELGIFDMNGNVWEWCWDWYNKDYYKIEDTNNPTGPARGENKTVRGGSWDSQLNYLRNSNRVSTPPQKTHEFYGFRIARNIK
jgi:formylglycine-generating enzyme required for sulfatase activity